MSSSVRSRTFRIEEILAAGKGSVRVLQQGTLDIVLGAPVRPNEQAPHEQDELYVVVRGKGVLLHNGKRDAFGPGDLMFVAAGVEHHFEEFGDDFLIWRIFYGPAGGEAA